MTMVPVERKKYPTTGKCQKTGRMSAGRGRQPHAGKVTKGAGHVAADVAMPELQAGDRRVAGADLAGLQAQRSGNDRDRTAKYSRELLSLA
jgi:hypothetical protein